MNDDNRPFPIQGGTYWDKENKKWVRPIKRYKPCVIPWWLAEEAYKHYSKLYGNSQSIERLRDRGGFGRDELLRLLRREIMS